MTGNLLIKDCGRVLQFKHIPMYFYTDVKNNFEYKSAVVTLKPEQIAFALQANRTATLRPGTHKHINTLPHRDPHIICQRSSCLPCDSET